MCARELLTICGMLVRLGCMLTLEFICFLSFFPFVKMPKLLVARSRFKSTRLRQMWRIIVSNFF